jgi:HK97 family phage prohead protease
MTILQIRFEPKVKDDGTFSGYGAYFGNRDSHGDVLERGCFLDSLADWRSQGRSPFMFLMHGASGNPFMHDDLPIGRWLSMREDSRGLFVEGQLLALDTDQGRRLLSLMKGGVLDGLSIGFWVKKSRPGTGSIQRYIEKVSLYELSIVHHPSNDLARVETISAADAAFDKLREAVAAIGGGKATEAPKSTSTKPKTYQEASDALGAAIARLRAETSKP